MLPVCNLSPLLQQVGEAGAAKGTHTVSVSQIRKAVEKEVKER